MKKMQMKFKVVAGSHFRGGKKFVAGDVVESTARLDQLFKGKFELLDGAPVGKVEPEIKSEAEPVEKSVSEGGEDESDDEGGEPATEPVNEQGGDDEDDGKDDDEPVEKPAPKEKSSSKKKVLKMIRRRRQPSVED